MKGTRAAVRYAKSLLELAIEKNILDTIQKDMASMDKVIAENHDLQLMLNSPVIKSDKKATVLYALFGSTFNELSMSFVQLITKNGREGLLPFIAQSFGELYKKHKGIVDVEIVSAIQLDDATKTAILDKVKTTYQGELVVTEKIDESVMGGFQVSVGDHQIDATIARRFRDLKQTLLN